MMAENRFDVSQEASMRFAWGPMAKKCRAPRLQIETFADGNGNLSGSINIYLGDAVGGIPWRVLEMGNARLSGIPGSQSVDYITIVPAAGSQGICSVAAGDAEEMTLTLGFPNGGGFSGAGFAPVADLMMSEFTPTVGQKYTALMEVYLPTGTSEGFFGLNLTTNPGNTSEAAFFGVAIQLNSSPNNAIILASNPGSGAAFSSQNFSMAYPQSGASLYGLRTLAFEFKIYPESLLDMRGFIDGLFCGYAGQVQMTNLSGEPLGYRTDYSGGTVESCKLYPGWLYTEGAAVLASAFA